MQKYDLIIFDNVGVPYTSTTLKSGGLGGSEFEVLLLAEGLAKSGYKVAVINAFKFPCTENGVDFWPADYLNNHTLNCKTLLIMRNSDVPVGRIEFDNIRFWFTDIPNEQQLTNLANWLTPGRPGVGICVSSWHKSLFPPMWNFSYIHNMIPDWVYDLSPKTKNPSKLMYCSAALKGLDQTIELWRELKKSYFLKKSELYVCHPGYDKVDSKKLETNKINFLGSLPFDKLVEELQTAQHLFYVNSFPETFCIVAALAEVLGVTPQVLTLQHPGALPEVVANSNFIVSDLTKFQKFVFDNAKTPPPLKKAKDYRVSTILPQWIKELKLQG
jgi:hypothetical protein